MLPSGEGGPHAPAWPWASFAPLGSIVKQYVSSVAGSCRLKTMSPSIAAAAAVAWADAVATADGAGDDVAGDAALAADPTGNADPGGLGTTDEVGAHEATRTPTTSARRTLTRASCRIRPSSISGFRRCLGDESAFDLHWSLDSGQCIRFRRRE